MIDAVPLCQLLLRLLTYDLLKVTHHLRERMGTCDGTKQIVGVFDVGDPITQRLVDGVLENTVTKCHFDHLGAQHAHAGHVERLSPCVDLSHVDAALETEHRTHGGRGNAVLSCSGLRDHAGLAHALDEQCLPDRIIDLMGTGMVEVLTLEEHSGVESGAFLDAFGESRRLGER